MAQVSQDTAAQLRLDFYKSVLTFSLATLGAEITLLHSLFKDSPSKGLAYASIIALMFACIFIIAAKEALVNRLDPLPTLHRLDRFLNRISLSSPTVERLLGNVSGGLYGLGLVLFVVFLLQH